MNDTELVQAVSEKVMGWTSFCLDYNNGARLETKKAITAWNPLADWNFTMEVVREMQRRGFDFHWTDSEVNTWIGFCQSINFVARGFDQRAICEAALLAVEEKEAT